ncbi:MAG: hypothetical protein OHK005_03100 [Candidatus Methylacidiphilales bacterium]
MNHTELASRLQAVATQLERHGSKLEGVAFAKAFGTFAKALANFEKKLEATIRGRDPSIEALQNLLKTHPGVKLVKVPSWRKLLQSTFGIRAPEGTAASLRKEFLQRAKDSGEGERAFTALQAEIARLSQPLRPVPADKTKLQEEFLRLGGLSDEDLLIELSSRWGKISDLRKLAEANAISGYKTAKRPRLEADIMHYARRAYLNIHRP